MKHKQIPLNTGSLLPPIGFGTWQIIPSLRAQRATTNAIDAGYRLIDTARIYGNEKGVGRAIAASEIPRSEIFLTTKLWNTNQGFDSAKVAFEKSLKRLGTDYVDLYLIHWPVTEKRLASWRALEEIYATGSARAVGVSNFTVRHLEELMKHSNIIPAVNQIELHPFIYNEQKELLDFCKKHRIVVEAYSPLAHGHRIDDPVLSRIAVTYGKTNAQVMLRWAVELGAVPIPKSTHVNRIQENIDIFDFSLTEREMQDIQALSDGTRTCWDPSQMK